MTLSKDARWKNLDDALLVLMDKVQGQTFLAVFVDERSLDSRILPTTWIELKNRYLVRQAMSWYYTLSGSGWIEGLKLLNQLDTPEMKSKAGKLCAALKDRVKGRQYEQIAHVSEIATEADLSEDFVRDAIESDLIRELFGTKGAGWATPEDRGKFIEIPVDFGLQDL
jgi:hypothetical protein